MSNETNDLLLRRAMMSNSGRGSVLYKKEQNLTEAQQMQARKNQGLYYKEGEGYVVTTEDPTNWYESYMKPDDLTEQQFNESSNIDHSYFKVSNDVPSKEDFISAYISGDGMDAEIALDDPSNITVTVQGQSIPLTYVDEDGYYMLTIGGEDPIFIVVTNAEDDLVINDCPVSNGIYCSYSIAHENNNTNVELSVHVTYNAGNLTIEKIPSEFVESASYSEDQNLTTAQKMKSRINQGLYATTTINDTFTFDGDLENASESVRIGDNTWLVKVSDRTDLDLNDVAFGVVTEDGSTTQFTISDCIVTWTDNINGSAVDPQIQVLLDESNYQTIACVANNSEYTPYTGDRGASSVTLHGLYIIYTAYDNSLIF